MTHAPLMSLETELQALPLRRSQCWASYLGPKKSPTLLPKEFCTERQGASGTIQGPFEKTAAAFPSPPSKLFYCSLPHSGEFGGIRGVKPRFYRQRSQKKTYGQTFYTGRSGSSRAFVWYRVWGVYVHLPAPGRAK